MGSVTWAATSTRNSRLTSQLVKAARAIKFMADKKKKAMDEQTAAIGASVSALLDRLEGAGGDEAVSLRWDVARQMPNLVESLDLHGDPMLEGLDVCRKRAAELRGGIDAG